MLTTNISRNSMGAIEYFKQGLSQEGSYYTKDAIKTYFEGKLAQNLGLKGKEVTEANFSDLVSNINPNTKGKLTQRNAPNRRAGFDLTLSAIKDISVLYELTGDEELIKAHRYANQKAMEVAESLIQTQENTATERHSINTGNAIYATFEHRTTRPVPMKKNGNTYYVAQPQVHSHNFFINATHNVEKNRVQAAEMYQLFYLAPYIQEVYHAHVSHRLAQIGYQVEKTAERYAIKGISRDIIKRFSERTNQIEKIAKEKGITGAAKAELGAKTRISKSKSVSEEQLYDFWKDSLTNTEFQTLKNLKGKYSGTTQKITIKEAVQLALDHFLERNSVAIEKRVLAHALTLSYGQFLPDNVQSELNRRNNIVRSDIDGISYITTREMITAENKMIHLATIGKGRFIPLNPDHQIRQDFLNDPQRSAVKELLSSRDQVQIFKGSAGTGKSSTVKELQYGIEASRKRLIAVAPSTQASEELKKKGVETHTIASLLHNPKLQEQLKSNVLLIEEAGMVGTKDMSQLLELGVKNDCRILMCGDIAQHSAPTYGDALRILEQDAQLRTVRLQKILRQKPQDYRKAVEYLSKGQTLKGYQALDKMNAIKEIPDVEVRLNTIAEEYITSIKSGRSSLIISPTHAEGEILNDIVRDKLREEKLLQGKEQNFETLKNLSRTQAQKKDVSNYQVGEIVRFFQNQKGGFKAGSHYEIIDIKNNQDVIIRERVTGIKLNLPYISPENYQVYKKTKTPIAKGDLIRITNNTKNLEGNKVTNGTSFKIKGFTKSGDLKLVNGKTLSKDTLHFKHGNVDTSYSSQGKDAQDIFIAQSETSFAASSDQQWYVSVSRGTQSVKIYTSDKDALKKAVMRSGERMSARELEDHHRKQLFHRKQYAQHRSINEKIKEHYARQRHTHQPVAGSLQKPKDYKRG